MGKFGTIMGKFGAKMGKFGSKRGKFGTIMGKFGAKMGKILWEISAYICCTYINERQLLFVVVDHVVIKHPLHGAEFNDFQNVQSANNI